MALRTAQYLGDGARELPVSPPTSPGEEGAKPRTPRYCAAAEKQVVEGLAAGLAEARLKGAPVGLLVGLAKRLSTAKQRAGAGRSAVSSMRAMELEEAAPPAGEMRLMRHAEAEALLNRELRMCESALCEVRWVKSYGDDALRESEALHAERQAGRREMAASTIQEFWRRHAAPPPASSRQPMRYTPAAERLDAEAASCIQAAWRRTRRRAYFGHELRMLRQLADLRDAAPPSAQTTYWPSALKLCVCRRPSGCRTGRVQRADAPLCVAYVGLRRRDLPTRWSRMRSSLWSRTSGNRTSRASTRASTL